MKVQKSEFWILLHYYIKNLYQLPHLISPGIKIYKTVTIQA